MEIVKNLEYSNREAASLIGCGHGLVHSNRKRLGIVRDRKKTKPSPSRPYHDFGLVFVDKAHPYKVNYSDNMRLALGI